MENVTQALSELLPYATRDKLRSYLDYVNERLIDFALEEGIDYRQKDLRRSVELVFFLKFLYGYLVVGFANYQQMLDYLESKGVHGFQIGGTAFTSGSDYTVRWGKVASELKLLVEDVRFTEYVRPTASVDHVLRQLLRSAPNKKDKKEGL